MTAVQAPARVALASADPARSGWDPVSWATIVVVVLFGCSQRYVIGAFGAAGSPAALGSLVAAAWWLIAVGSAAVPGLGRQPARPLLLLFWAAGLSGYAAAWSRSLSATEGHAADRTLLQWLGYGGLALLIADGVGSRARLDVLVGRLLGAATALAVAGIGQFVTGVDPARLLLLPLHWNNAEGLGAQGFRRGGLLRIAATTLHPIEFGVVLAALLPLAVVNALAGLHKPRWRRWSPPLLIGAAIPLAISRAAVIGLAVGMVWLIGALTSSARLRLGAAAIAAATLSILSWPRLLDTLGKAFWGIGSDPSITARTRSPAFRTEPSIR